MFPFSRFARYFIEVARLGSLRKAAESLHISASAIDRQILSVEAQLETPLFDRLSSGLRLTAAGELLLGDLVRWQKEFVRSRERLDDLKGLNRGQVNIALIDAVSEGPIPQALCALGREHPQMQLGIRVLGNQEVFEQVAKGEVDVGLMLNPTEGPALTIHALVEIPLGIAMAVDHPLASSASLSLSAVLGSRQLLPAAPLIVNDAASALYRRHGIEPEHLSHCDDIRLLRTLVRGGVGVSLLSLLDVLPDLHEGRIAFSPLRGRQHRSLTLALCVPPRRQLSRAALAAIDRLAQVLETLTS